MKLPYKLNHIVDNLFECDFFLHSKCLSAVLESHRAVAFLLLSKCSFMDAPLLVYPISCWRRFALLPGVGNYEESCYKHSHIGFYKSIIFHLYNFNTQTWDRWVVWCVFIRNCQTVFQSGCSILQSMRVLFAQPFHQHFVL